VKSQAFFSEVARRVLKTIMKFSCFLPVNTLMILAEEVGFPTSF